MKFAKFVLFHYIGKKNFKLIRFMNNGTQLIVSHPQPNPNAAHGPVIINLFQQIIKSVLLSPSLRETNLK
ncbi:hypothetical protein Hdeb2414_s0016g00494401 [Helianthus debilis subsp. tardiflorus]